MLDDPCECPRDAVRAIAFSPTALRLAIVCEVAIGVYDMSLERWSHVWHTFSGISDPKISFRPCGRLIAIAHNDSLCSDIEIWDYEQDELRGVLLKQAMQSQCIWSPDGSLLACAFHYWRRSIASPEQEVFIWSMLNFEDSYYLDLTSIQCHFPPSFLSFSPDGRLLSMLLSKYELQDIAMWDCSERRWYRSIPR